MQRITVDFNTLNSDPVDLVKFPRTGFPTLQVGERVVLTDGELEVEATVVEFTDARGTVRLMAAPDADTWRDLVPQSTSLPPAQEAQQPLP